MIGMGAIVSNRAKIGSWSIIAEGSVVKMNQVIPDKVVAAGNPSRIVRQIEERDISRWNAGKQLYIDLAKNILKLEWLRLVEVNLNRACPPKVVQVHYVPT